MERNNSDAGEILAGLSILTEMSDGYLEFGDRLRATKNKESVYFTAVNDTCAVDTCIAVSELLKIKDALRAELLVKKAMRGKMEYNSINRYGALLGCDTCLVSPAGRLDDFVLNGKTITFKASIQNKAGILHYSKLFGFRFLLQNISEDEAQNYALLLSSKKKTLTDVLKTLINENKVQIIDDEFCIKDSDELTFFEFLRSLDDSLPRVYQKLKYRQVELSKHAPTDLLAEDEIVVFKKFVDVINHGLSTTNFSEFKPVNMSIIVMTRQLTMIYHTLDQPEDIEWMMKHLYVDSGDASRTGSGRIYKENDKWFMTADIYFKFDYHE